MKILSLDSSSPVVSIAFLEFSTKANLNPAILFRKDTAHKRSDSSALFNGVQAAVTSCGLPDAICVGLGPGSYNGLRAGIAAARAFASALEIPLLALPSPLALPGPDSGFWAIGDARGGHYWIACVQEGKFLEVPDLVRPSEITTHFQTHSDFPILAATPLPEVEDLSLFQLATPDAARLAFLAKNTDPIACTPEPLYLKPPNITLPRTASPLL